MLTSVQVMDPSTVGMEIPISNPGHYTIEDIEGLDPVKAILTSTAFANTDGEQHQSSRRDKRNLVFKIALNPTWSNPAPQTVRELRASLYRYFMPKRKVRLRFISSDMDMVEISGVVESFDCPLFVREPRAAISIICHQPDFVNPNQKAWAGTSASAWGFQSLPYLGDLETGFRFQFNIPETISSFGLWTLYEDGGFQRLDFAGSLISGDVVNISTVPGNKYATRTRSGNTISILSNISPTSVWPTLVPGVSNVWLQKTGTSRAYSILWNDRYGGL